VGQCFDLKRGAAIDHDEAARGGKPESAVWRMTPGKLWRRLPSARREVFNCRRNLLAYTRRQLSTTTLNEGIAL
jgi:hypothetical protein